MNKLSDISNLADNWNGNGASAFPRALLDKIREIIPNLSFQPDIFPTAASSIQFEYDGDNDSYLEIEINESETAEVYRINRDGSEEFLTMKSDCDSLNKLVRNFYEDPDDGIYRDKDGRRLYTEEEVWQVIHGMECEHGLPYGDNLISDYVS